MNIDCTAFIANWFFFIVEEVHITRRH